MTTDPSQVRVGATGTLYRAPIGTALPADAAAAWPAGWVDLGLLDEDNPFEMTPSQESKEIRAWQRTLPVRVVQTSRGMEYKANLIQKSGTSLKTAFGGGTIETLSAGQYRYHPPAASANNEEMQVALEVVDGTVVDRWILLRASISDSGSIPFQKDEAVAFELTWAALGVTSGDQWTLISNDPAMGS